MNYSDLVKAVLVLAVAEDPNGNALQAATNEIDDYLASIQLDVLTRLDGALVHPHVVKRPQFDEIKRFVQLRIEALRTRLVEIRS
jgi:hypothetical protein